MNKIFYFICIAVLLLWSGFEIQSGRLRIGGTTINDSTTAITTFNKNLYVPGGYFESRDSVKTSSLTGDVLYLNGLGSSINFRGSGTAFTEGSNTMAYTQDVHGFETRHATQIITFDSANCITIKGATIIRTGTGSPESVVTAPVGSLFLRTDNANSLYVKQTGSGNTGWILK